MLRCPAGVTVAAKPCVDDAINGDCSSRSLLQAAMPALTMPASLPSLTGVVVIRVLEFPVFVAQALQRVALHGRMP